MAAEPITIFAPFVAPAAVAQRLRNLVPSVEIDGPDDDWRNAVVAFGEGENKQTLTFTHDPEYYAEPNWSNQMSGMRGFFSRFPDTARKPQMMMLTQCLQFGLGTLFDPDFDPDGDDRLSVLFDITELLDGVLFTPSALRDAQGRILYGAGAEEDEDPDAIWPAAIEELPTLHEKVVYPSPDTWEDLTDGQRQRAGRVFEQLKKRNVPVFSGPLLLDSEDCELQSAQEVARRVLVLWAVVLRAEGAPKEEALKLIEHHNLWDSVSAKERSFLENDDPDPDESQALVWRLESIWVLLWALGYLNEFDWPVGMCDVPKLVDIVRPRELEPEFVSAAQLRGRSDILDAQHLTMRIHWAIRETYVNGIGLIPEDLDWSTESEMVAITMSPAVGVIEQRHHVLNWLINFPDAEDWDHVDTPT